MVGVWCLGLLTLLLSVQVGMLLYIYSVLYLYMIQIFVRTKPIAAIIHRHTNTEYKVMLHMIMKVYIKIPTAKCQSPLLRGGKCYGDTPFK